MKLTYILSQSLLPFIVVQQTLQVTDERIIIVPNVIVIKLNVKGRNNSWHCWAKEHGTKAMLGVVGSKYWPVSNFAQHLPTTCNRVCKRTKHVTSNNLASVCTKLNVTQPTLSHLFPVVAYARSIILSEIASRVTPTRIGKWSVKESFSTKEAETYGRNYKLFASGNN